MDNMSFEDNMPSLIAAAFLYAYPNENLHTIIEKRIWNVEYSLRALNDLGPGLRDILLITDFSDYEYVYYRTNPSYTSYQTSQRNKYCLTYTMDCVTCDICFRSEDSNMESECGILRLSMFLYLLNNANCCDGFERSCPIWFYDPYNLPAVLKAFDEDIKRNYTDVLKAYLDSMDRYGIEFNDIVEKCQELGYMELLMYVMRIMNAEPKQQEKFRL